MVLKLEVQLGDGCGLADAATFASCSPASPGESKGMDGIGWDGMGCLRGHENAPGNCRQGVHRGGHRKKEISRRSYAAPGAFIPWANPRPIRYVENFLGPLSVPEEAS